MRRQVKWGLYAVGLFLILEYLVLPQLAGARKSLHLLGRINFAYVIAGVVLEAASLASYSQLTHTVLHHGGPHRSRLLRINLSSLSVSHLVPGRHRAGNRRRLPSPHPVGRVGGRRRLRAGHAGRRFRARAQFDPVVGTAGVGLRARLQPALRRGRRGRCRAHGPSWPEWCWRSRAGATARSRSCRRGASHVPFLDGDKLAIQAQRVADRLGQFLAEPQVLRRAIGWAAAFWLLDAASLFVFIAALGTIVSPIDLLVAYGLAQVLAVIPITPSGLGVVEGVLIPTLTGFGVPQEAAILGVLGYRLVNFWLPIPVGGIAYLSLRFSGEGWRQRLRHARDEVSSLEGDGVEHAPPTRSLRSAD